MPVGSDLQSFQGKQKILLGPVCQSGHYGLNPTRGVVEGFDEKVPEILLDTTRRRCCEAT